MSDPDPPAVNHEAVLDAAPEFRAEHLVNLVRGRLQRGIPRFAWSGITFWLVLAVASLVWIALAGSDRGHAVTVMCAISLASLVSSIGGFAFSAICGAILFHFHDDPIRVVQIMITCSIANQAAMTWASRRQIDWRGLRMYFLGGALGLTIGVWVLLNVDRALYTHVFGAFLLIYGTFMLVRKQMVIRRQPAAADFATGVLGGVTGGAAGFPGAFVTIWCSMKGWDKGRQRAVVQPFILIMQVATLLVIGIAHRPNGEASDSILRTCCSSPRH